MQGFAKAMLDVADNLERAAGMVEGRTHSQDSEELDLDKTTALLTSLHDGVKLTDKILIQVRISPPSQAGVSVDVDSMLCDLHSGICR